MAYTFTNNSGQTISSANSTPAQMAAHLASGSGTPQSGSTQTSSQGTNQYNMLTGAKLTPGQSYNFQGQTITQGTPVVNMNTPANVNQLRPQPPLNLPPPQQAPVDFMTGVAPALSMYNVDGTAKDEKTLNQEKTNLDLAYLKQMFEATPPSSAEAWNKAQQESGYKKAQKEVADLTGKLNMITAQGQASQLAVVGQGRGIPETIIGGQQAQIARETAIQALPVSAQLQAAQGNLEMAQQNVNMLFKIYSEDATNAYNHKQKVYEALYTVASNNQKRQLDKIDKMEERAYNEKQRDFEFARTLANKAIDNNQGSVAGEIMTLNKNSPTYMKDVARVSRKIYDAGKALDDELKRVTINTKVQELANAKLPGAGKPPTEGQIASAGYADRINQANTVIDSKADVFKKMTYADFKLAESKSQIANAFMSKDVRQASQAMRNFITAKLRKESGAAISQSEFDDARLQYFPAYKDDAQTLLQKKALRDSVYNNLVLGAGSAYSPNTVNNYLDTAVIPSLNNLSLPNATNYWNSIQNP